LSSTDYSGIDETIGRRWNLYCQLLRRGAILLAVLGFGVVVTIAYIAWSYVVTLERFGS
jgi:phage shock protein PspC (stress-responsive transcriptional regulator)